MRIRFFFIVIFIAVVANRLAAQQSDVQKKLEQQILLRARAYEQSGRYQEALSSYRELWTKSRKNINYYRGVYNNLVRLGRFEEAERTVREMLQYVKSDLVQADLGEILFKMGRDEDAYAAWKKILETRPKSQSAYQIVALAMQRNSLFDKALEVYLLGQKNLKNDKLFLIDIANLYRSQRDFVNAAEQYIEYLAAFPNQYTFVESNLISMMSDPDYSDEIIAILKEKVKKHPQNVNIRRLLAAANFRKSRYNEALQQYQEIDQLIARQNKSERERLGREIYQFAQNAYNDGEYEFALQGYQLLLQRYPKSTYAASAKMAVGKCLRFIGKYEEAISYFEKLSQESKNPVLEKNAIFQIGEIYLFNLNDYEKAEQAYREVIRVPLRNPLEKTALFRIGQCYIKQQKLARARAWFEDLIAGSNLNREQLSNARYILGKINFWTGDFKSARLSFQSVIEEPILLPERNEGIYANDAMEYVMLIDEVTDKELLKEFANAQFKKEIGDLEHAEKILQNMLAKDDARDLKDRILAELGEIHFQMKKYASAISDFKRLIETYPESYLVDLAQKRIGDAYWQGLNDGKAAAQAYELVLERYPDSIFLEEVRAKIREIETREKN